MDFKEGAISCNKHNTTDEQVLNVGGPAFLGPYNLHTI